MSPKNNYKQFVSQFSLPEWKLLCKHRLFLHFLKTDLRIAASIAAGSKHRRYLCTANRRAPTLRTTVACHALIDRAIVLLLLALDRRNLGGP